MTPAEEAQFRRFWAAHAEQPLVGRNRILASICPQLHGLFLVKLATALMLIGGVAQRDPHTGARCRGELHMLLVGDPGTGAFVLRTLLTERAARAAGWRPGHRCLCVACLTQLQIQHCQLRFLDATNGCEGS